MRLLPQQFRLVVLALSIALLTVLSKIALGGWVPPFDERGLWFYAGLYAFLTGSLLEAPTHTTPAQGLGFAALAGIATAGFGLSTWDDLDPVARGVWVAVLLGEVAVVGAAVAAILWKDRTEADVRARLGASAFIVSSSLGRPHFVSFGPFVFAVLAYHRASPREGLILALGWAILVMGRPLERGLALAFSLREVWSAGDGADHLGEIVGHSVPRLITLRHRGPAKVEPGSTLLVQGDDGRPNVAVSLNYVGVSDGHWLRALQLDISATLRNRIPRALVTGGRCSHLRSGDLMLALQESGDSVFARREQLLGIVAPGTTSAKLRFEIAREDQELAAGRLLEVQVRDRPVLYQLLDGITKEEIVKQKSTRGYIEAEARRVGYWDASAGHFQPASWIPQPNTPVFLATLTEGDVPESAIGTFPGTSYPVGVDTTSLVTHNAAILGILGVGKTYLGLELVERMIRDGVRVICLDLTDEYALELDPYLDAKWQNEWMKKLQKLGEAGEKNVQRNVEDGGSLGEFGEEVSALLTEFLDPKGSRQLLLVNPSDFEVWRQDSKPYQEKASMASLSAAEITQVFSEAALLAAQALGRTNAARCCLVYEEAHSLVPEWTAVVADGDRSASNGTARAILQGRKYGLGCLLITQRTASVTKSILNQCNTVFAMRVFDATGMDFLANYIGRDYVEVLSGLEDRHAVVFGKASSCADPVLVRANDRADFLSRVREERQE